jgi:hypothetical protein
MTSLLEECYNAVAVLRNKSEATHFSKTIGRKAIYNKLIQHCSLAASLQMSRLSLVSWL